MHTVILTGRSRRSAYSMPENVLGRKSSDRKAQQQHRHYSRDYHFLRFLFSYGFLSFFFQRFLLNSFEKAPCAICCTGCAAHRNHPLALFKPHKILIIISHDISRYFLNIATFYINFFNLFDFLYIRHHQYNSLLHFENIFTFYNDCIFLSN